MNCCSCGACPRFYTRLPARQRRPLARGRVRPKADKGRSYFKMLGTLNYFFCSCSFKDCSSLFNFWLVSTVTILVSPSTIKRRLFFSVTL